MSKTLLLVALMVIAIGCTRRLGDLTVATNRNVAISSFDPASMRSTRTEGKHCVGVVLGIPLGVPNIEDAIDNALIRAGSNFMTDVVLRTTFWTAIIYGQNCMKVEGNAWEIGVSEEGDEDGLREFVSGRGGTQSQVHIRLADSSTATGEIAGFGTKQIFFLPSTGGPLQVIDRASVLEVQTVQEGR